MVEIDVKLVPRLDENDLGAHAFRVCHDGSGAHAKGLGLVAGRDAAVVSAIIGTTPTGRPRSSGRASCSHEAK